ncbi:MAG: BMP family ABC transporter substrate-binding protein [Burkholderiaceae bacterium]
MFKNLSGAGLPLRDLFTLLIAVSSSLVFLGVSAQTPPQSSDPAKPLGVALVLVGPKGEPGWSYQHHQGLLAMEKALGTRVKTTVVEKVNEGPDAERVIRELAQSGNGLIFTTSFGYMEPTLRVAKDFPATRFVHVSGYKTAPNVATVNARFYEGRYLAGLAAGKTTKSGTLGYVAAFPIPEVVQGINAFARGARAANPKAQVRVIWTASWFDPGKERDAALALIAQQADVLAYHTGSLAVPQLAQEKGVGLIAYHTDISKLAPNTQILAVVHEWGAYYTRAAQQVLSGSWTTDAQWNGLNTGAIRLTGWNAAVPATTKSFVDAQAKQISGGKLHPFNGPVKDNTGNVRWEQGAMTDEALSKMDYLVEGVIGSIPK